MVGPDSYWSLPSPEVLRSLSTQAWFLNTGLSPSMAFHSMIVFLTLPVAYESPTTPNKLGLGCSLFARRLLRESLRFLFFRVLRYFSSPTYQLDTLHVKLLWFESEGVTPFGHRRIEAFCQLPGDFRGLKTSFFGSYCLGIRYLLFANKLNLKFCYF